MPPTRYGYTSRYRKRRSQYIPSTYKPFVKKSRYSYRPKRTTRRKRTKKSFSKKKKYTTSRSVKPSFRTALVGNRTLALPVVRDDKIIVLYTGRQGTVYFKEYYSKGNQYITTDSNLTSLLVRSTAIKRDLTKYHSYYGVGAIVQVYFAPLKADSDGLSRPFSLGLAEYVKLVIDYQGFLKSRSLQVEGFEVLGIRRTQAAAPAPPPAFQSTPMTPRQ